MTRRATKSARHFFHQQPRRRPGRDHRREDRLINRRLGRKIRPPQQPHRNGVCAAAAAQPHHHEAYNAGTIVNGSFRHAYLAFQSDVYDVPEAGFCRTVPVSHGNTRGNTYTPERALTQSSQRRHPCARLPLNCRAKRMSPSLKARHFPSRASFFVKSTTGRCRRTLPAAQPPNAGNFTRAGTQLPSFAVVIGDKMAA